MWLTAIEPCVHKNHQIQVIGLINLCASLILITHILACIWVTVGKEGKVLNGPTWISQANYEVGL